MGRWIHGALFFALVVSATAGEAQPPLLVRVEDGAGTRLELAHARDARHVKLCVGPPLGVHEVGELGLDPLGAIGVRAGPLGVLRWDVSSDVVGGTGLAAQALVVGANGRVALSNVVALARRSEANAGAGRVLVTELMIDPVAVPDAVGEWIELTSRAPCRLDLTGWELSDGGRDRHRIAGRGGGPLWIGPGERLVLGNSGDRARNGGVHVDHVVARFVLANDADTVRLTDRSGAVVDEVVYDAKSWRLRPGRSMAFRPELEASDVHDALRNDPASWCPSTSELPSGDRGTPGAPNDRCDA